jgi:hypothetical protein
MQLLTLPLNFHINALGADIVSNFSRGYCAHNGELVEIIIDYENRILVYRRAKVRKQRQQGLNNMTLLTKLSTHHPFRVLLHLRTSQDAFSSER